MPQPFVQISVGEGCRRNRDSGLRSATDSKRTLISRINAVAVKVTLRAQNCDVYDNSDSESQTSTDLPSRLHLPDKISSSSFINPAHFQNSLARVINPLPRIGRRWAGSKFHNFALNTCATTSGSGIYIGQFRFPPSELSLEHF